VQTLPYKTVCDIELGLIQDFVGCMTKVWRVKFWVFILFWV